MAKKLSDMERGFQTSLDQSINVLVTGKSGTSKSILVNGIFGKEVVKERHGVLDEARSSEINFYSESVDGIAINIWVSAHLQDGGIPNEEEYLLDVKTKCSNVDLILYCLKMTETRFIPGNPDAQAMKKLSEALGHNCWKKTVFILTHANVAARVPDTSISPESSPQKMFEDSIKNWKSIIQNTLSKEANVPGDSLDISVVPAGHYSEPHLPDREYWLSVLWDSCHEAIQSEHSRTAFLQINRSRFQKAMQIKTSELSHLKLVQQPLMIHYSYSYQYIKIISVGVTILGFLIYLRGFMDTRSYPNAVLIGLGMAIGGFSGLVLLTMKRARIFT